MDSPAVKRVVYLFGAGATQSESSYLGASNTNLLMRDDDALGPGVATRILGRMLKTDRAALQLDEAVDLEKLISLLIVCNVDSLSKLAETIRELYFQEIRDSMATAKILDRPRLAIALLKMHSNEHFTKHVEKLRGIITTNHDGLLQLAAHRVFSRVNIGFPFVSQHFQPGDDTPPILQLHGSFTWEFSLPIEVNPVQNASNYSPDTVWIPPTILKESKSYPFNKLAALAYELLSKDCDVLRVVGSSLTQNDWNIQSLIFSAQKHRELTRETAFTIQLVMPPKASNDIKHSCGYLKKLTPIGYLSEGHFDELKEENSALWQTGMDNPFAYWMKEKILYHRRRGEFGSGPLDPDMADVAGGIA
jgi:hypothetical protein